MANTVVNNLVSKVQRADDEVRVNHLRRGHERGSEAVLDTLNRLKNAGCVVTRGFLNLVRE